MTYLKAKKRLTVRDIRSKKGGPLVCLTAYTHPMALLVDEVADLILVGDSLGNVLYGFESTLPVTLEMMIAHGGSVMRGSKRACVVVDMPFGSYQESPAQAFQNAARVLVETGCHAIKLEGGEEMAETVSFLTRRGIAVLGHVGLMPQHVHARGGFRRESDVDKVVADARAIAQAGAFALVVEGVKEEVARAVTAGVEVPTIGIAAGDASDGEIRVTEDLLGVTPNPPGFVEAESGIKDAMRKALSEFAESLTKPKA